MSDNKIRYMHDPFGGITVAYTYDPARSAFVSSLARVRYGRDGRPVEQFSRRRGREVAGGRLLHPRWQDRLVVVPVSTLPSSRQEWQELEELICKEHIMSLSRSMP